MQDVFVYTRSLDSSVYPEHVGGVWVETKPKLNFHDGEERKRGEEVANKTCTLLMCRRSLNLTVYSKRVG